MMGDHEQIAAARRRDLERQAKRIRGLKCPSDAPKLYGHDGALRVGERRRRTEAIQRHQMGRPPTPGTPSKFLRGRHGTPAAEPKPESTSTSFAKRSSRFMLRAPPGSANASGDYRSDVLAMEVAEGSVKFDTSSSGTGADAPGLRRRLAKGARTLAIGVGRPLKNLPDATSPEVAAHRGWLWFLEGGGAWRRRFYELHGTTLLAFDAPRQWTAGKGGGLRIARRRLEVGFAVANADLCTEVAGRDRGFAFAIPDLARAAAAQPDGLPPRFLAMLEAEAPLSLTIYGREDRKDVAALFRTDRDDAAVSWVTKIRNAVEKADVRCLPAKTAAAKALVADLATAQALTAHRREAVLGELARQNLVDRRQLVGLKEGLVEVAYLPPLSIGLANLERAKLATPNWLRVFCVLGEDAALHLGADAAEARGAPLLSISLRNADFDVDAKTMTERGVCVLELRTQLRTVLFRARHKIALEQWLRAMCDCLEGATRANDMPGRRASTKGARDAEKAFRAGDGPSHGKGAVAADAARRKLEAASDDVLDLTLDDVLREAEPRKAFCAFLGDGRVVDCWRAAGAVLDHAKIEKDEIRGALRRGSWGAGVGVGVGGAADRRRSSMANQQRQQRGGGGGGGGASKKLSDPRAAMETLRAATKLVWYSQRNEWGLAETMDALPDGVLGRRLHEEVWQAISPVDQAARYF